MANFDDLRNKANAEKVARAKGNYARGGQVEGAKPVHRVGPRRRADGGDLAPVSPLYDKETLSGPRLNTLIENAEGDDTLDKIRRSLEHHNMMVPPRILSRARGGVVRKGKSQ